MASAPAAGSSVPSVPKPPLAERLRAWWDGYDLVPRPRSGEVPTAASLAGRPPIELPSGVKGWPAPRIAASQLLFGEDFIWPGEALAIDNMLKPLGLNEKMSVLELGAGLGGGARLMAKNYGAWVNALERDPGLAAAGNALSTKHGLARKAPVTLTDYMNLSVREKTIDAVLARAALSTVEDKEALISKLVGLFKPGGQLLIADMALGDGADANDPELVSWQVDEPTPCHLWDAARIRATVERKGIEVRIMEDTTAGFRHQALSGFADSAALLADKSIDPTLKGWILWETEMWARRLALMEKGLLAVYRLYGTHNGRG